MVKYATSRDGMSYLALAIGFLFAVTVPSSVQPAFGAAPAVYASPENAVSALVDAAWTKGMDGLVAVLGSGTEEWISSGDPVQDKQDLERFFAAFDRKNLLEKTGDGKMVLVVGDDGFPFPFPIVKTAAGWAFDPEQGKEELLNRRIGRNELNTIQVLLAMADAQFEYASADRNGDGILEYAAKLASSEGIRDGLYWPTEEGEPLSPLGPLVAEAVRQGYERQEQADRAAGEVTQPYHGYHFKLLSGQGEAALGGAHDYTVAGRSIGGFAVLAFPARYGNSGIMSFMISHEGIVYDADLGPETLEEAGAIDTFDPYEGWKKVDLK